MSGLRAPTRYSTPPGTLNRERNWTLRASYVEIYNEQLRDLLVPEHIPMHEREQVGIRQDTKGNIILTGLRQVEVNSVEELMAVLAQGSTLRQTDATAVNARSSRSHAVFSLNLLQKKNRLQSAEGQEKRHSMPLEVLTGGDMTVTTDSKMHFVDLAGSERLKNTGAQGERAKEGISINGGLAALGKVISQLSSRQPGAHVSYRDSKLTRLLQDSLGGNAITYMIACVTPVEFHLSETLNTVQYAQRARAIQSKPRIQQVDEGGDKQAIIDRLKAEVAFLREQIRSAERKGGTMAPGERSEREIELQNRLLDAEENYRALSTRHAKLIAEMAKAREAEVAERELAESAETADERIHRSNSFAQAVEQVVLEYEKTIQALEHSLASTRATLAITEGNLLEKETRCAYTETINSQLQARLQKLMDREASTEHYLHDLETKLDGYTDIDERNAAIIAELRKEVARAREAEANCEDYISTLEERLAEADQDAELMQREIDRLEQIVERQRSLGKLDSLLYELDNIQQQDGVEDSAAPGLSNGAGHRRTASRSIEHHSRSQSHVSRHSQLEDTIPESEQEDMEDGAVARPPPATTIRGHGRKKAASIGSRTGHSVDYSANAAQNKFMADKLESVTQELLDLRTEHENTLNEMDLLQAKYEEALRALAELQDVVDETRHPAPRPRDSILSVAENIRPPSFLSDSRTHETREGAQPSSRSLSSELSSAMETPATPVETSASDAETAVVPPKSSPPLPMNEATQAEILATELERLKAIAAEREAAEKELAERYAQLEAQHQQTLDMVEELKTEVAKAQAQAAAASSGPTSPSPVIRRKSSQNIIGIDRAHRSFASLRNIAAENFENQPEVMQNFELNLNAAMHELHSKAERIQELEADVATAKREMETKMTIISGLTRERSSLNLDHAMVSGLREQLEKSEEKIRELQESHAKREKELEEKVAELNESLRLMKEAAEKQESEAKKAAEEAEKKVEQLKGELEKVKEEAAASREVAKEDVAKEPVAEEAPEEAPEKKAVDEFSKEEVVTKGNAAAVAAEVASLRESLKKTEESEASAKAAAADSAAQVEKREQRIAELEAELAQWEERHIAALQSATEAEGRLKHTISDLEAKIVSISAQLAEAESNQKAVEQTPQVDPEELVQKALQEAEEKHMKLVEFLRNEIDEYKGLINTNQGKVAEAEAQHAATKKLLEIAAADRDAATSEAQASKELVAKLEAQVADYEQTIKAHQESLRELQSKHEQEIEQIMATSKQEHEAEIAKIKTEHANRVRQLESDLTEAREDLMKVATQVAWAMGLEVSVEKLSERIEELAADQRALVAEQEKRAELEQQFIELSNINDTILRDLETVRMSLAEIIESDSTGKPTRAKSPYQLVDQVAMVKQRVAELEAKNEKNSRVVEELEQQLQNNFDQNNRLSTLQMEKNAQLQEATAAKQRLERELEAIREDYNALQVSFEPSLSQSSQTLTANQAKYESLLTGRADSPNKVRKSSSVTSLPSPPPAIPLPPLPNGATTSGPGTTSPTPRPPSKDIGPPSSAATLASQIQEDQEARIRLIEKHLKAEKQLTATLEEALTDLERQQATLRQETDMWKRRAEALETECKELREKATQWERQQENSRWSMQQVEEERRKRRDAEIARQHLEERMQAIGKKKKKGSLNCF